MAIFLVKMSAQDVPCIFCMVFLPSFESHAPNLKDTPMKLHETINRVVVETFWCLAMAPEAVLLNNLSRKARIWARQKMHPLCVGMHIGPISIRKRKNAKKIGLWVSLDLSTAGEKNASSAILGYEPGWISLDCRWSKDRPVKQLLIAYRWERTAPGLPILVRGGHWSHHAIYLWNHKLQKAGSKASR